MSQFWTDDDQQLLDMSLAFVDYADAGEGELRRLRVLLHYLLTEVTPENVCGILARFSSVMARAKPWTDFVDEAHEIVRISRECDPDYEETEQAWLAWMKQAGDA